MQIDSLQVRRTALAYVFPSAIRLDRRDNLAFYDKVTESGVELPELQQLPQEVVLLQRKPPEYVNEVRVGALQMMVPGAAPTGAAFRLLIAEQGSSKPMKFFTDTAENCFSAFRQVWGARHGKVQMVEVALVGTVSCDGNEGPREFIRNRVLRIGKIAQNQLGREQTEFSVRLGAGMLLIHGPEMNAPVPNAQLDLTLETIPNESRLLAINLVAKFAGVQLPVTGIPEAHRAQLGGRQVLEINQELLSPSQYVDPVYAFLTTNVMAFLADAAR
jgi:hypothetical protein